MATESSIFDLSMDEYKGSIQSPPDGDLPIDGSRPDGSSHIAMKKIALKHRSKSVKILCIGVTCTGKSTLINAMLGDTVARTGFGPKGIQTDIAVHEGEYDDIRIDIYDTIGFSDCNISEKQIMKELTNSKPKEGFDLVLLCLRMDARVDVKVKQMLQSLLQVNWLNSEILKRMVVVLTFANFFLRLDKIEDLKWEGKEEAIRQTIEEFRDSVGNCISGMTKKEIIDDIPFCLAGRMKERQLPTVEDWLITLWETCILRCREETRSLLTQLVINRLKELKIPSTVMASGLAIGAAVGGGVGAGLGTIVPGIGTVIGASIGATVGGVGTAIVTGAVVTAKRHYSQSEEDNNCDTADKTSVKEVTKQTKC